MDLNNINQDEIIQNITNEVIQEFQDSNENFTSQDIKDRISEKLEELFIKIKEEQTSKEIELDNEEDEFLRNEFTNISLSLPSDNYDTYFEHNPQQFSEEDTNNEDTAEETTDEEDKVKEPFFKNFKELYTEELQRSIKSFKNSVDVFAFMKESSIIEKFLIALFLSIPAVFAGSLGLLFIPILLLLWQFYVLINVIIKQFDKIETKITDTITKFKNKLITIKNNSGGGGLIYRLLFSCLLYSLITLNGILYLFIKGVAFPIRTVAEIDRIIANLGVRSLNGITSIFRSPSMLALNDSKSNKTKKDRNTDGKMRGKLNSRDIVRQRQTLRLSERMQFNKTANMQLNGKISKIDKAKQIIGREKQSIQPKVSLKTPELKQNLVNQIYKNVITNQVKNVVATNTATMTQTKDNIKTDTKAREKTGFGVLSSSIFRPSDKHDRLDNGIGKGIKERVGNRMPPNPSGYNGGDNNKSEISNNDCMNLFIPSNGERPTSAQEDLMSKLNIVQQNNNNPQKNINDTDDTKQNTLNEKKVIVSDTLSDERDKILSQDLKNAKTNEEKLKAVDKRLEYERQDVVDAEKYLFACINDIQEKIGDYGLEGIVQNVIEKNQDNKDISTQNMVVDVMKTLIEEKGNEIDRKHLHEITEYISPVINIYAEQAHEYREIKENVQKFHENMKLNMQKNKGKGRDFF